MKPQISIIIPTHCTEYGQHTYLFETLNALLHTHGYDDELVEIIVVENPEKTQTVIDIIDKSLHNRLYKNIVHTSCGLGANKARNYGIKLAQGNIIALLDDDCIVEQRWLQGVLAAHQLYPQVGVIGGAMKLVFADPKPRWIEGYFCSILAAVDHGEGTHDLTNYGGNPYTAMIVSGNLTFKKSVYNQAGGFDETIGYIGDNCMSQDEIEFVYEATKIGTPGRLYIGNIVVYHHIPPTRLTIDYFRKKSYGDGYNYAKMIAERTPDAFLEDVVSDFLLPIWNQYFEHHDITHIRQIIAHEESTRLYIYHLMLCRLSFFTGFSDFLQNTSVKSYSEQFEKSFLMNSVSSEVFHTW